MTRPIALVTGAAHRIGRAIATDLAANGFDVALHANRSTDEAELLASSLRPAARAAVVTGDLGDAHAVAALVPAAQEALGPLSLVVNNASLFESDGAAEPDSARFRRHMAVNAEAPLQLAAALYRLSSAADRMVINLIDQRVWKPTPTYVSYSASKAALWWLTQTLAQAYAPDVRVNALAPGPVLQATTQTAADFEALVDAVPLKRSPAPADFGAAIRFLYGQASITGQMLALDGGQHLSWKTPDALITE
ncbi:MAG: SDR family oxidoreductase [Pseudomonadota bacterium]